MWQTLVVDHLGIVRAMARDISRTLPIDVGEDLIGPGHMGLVEAARRFDPNRGVGFATYAKHRVRGAMLDYIRSLDSNSRSTRRQIRSLTKLRDQLEDPSEEALAAAAGMTLIELRKHYSRKVGVSRTPFNELVPPSADERGTILAALLIHQVLAELPDRLRYILRSHYVDGVSMKEIGKTLGVGPSYMSKLRARALSIAREIALGRANRAETALAAKRNSSVLAMPKSRSAR